MGIPPLTYQWYRAAASTTTQLAGATNAALELTNVLSLDAGDYYVRVNSEGVSSQSQDSRPATLTVLNNGPAQPPLFETPRFAAAGTFQFRLITERGRAYEVQFTPSLENQSWTVIQTVRGTGEPVVVAVPGGTAEGYYRAKVIP
jgi:hypothetical protein